MRVLPRSLPIRWRLTAVNVAVLVATIITLGGLFLLQLDSALVGIAAENLREQARPFLIGQERRSPPGDQDAREGPPGFNLTRAGGFMVRAFNSPDTGVDVYDPSGEVVASSDTSETSTNAEEWPAPDPDQLRNALNGAEVRTIVRQQTRRTLILLLPLRSPDGSVAGVLQLSRSLDLIQQLEDRLRLSLLVGTLLAAIVAAALSLRLTRAALKPLDSVIGAARRIGAGDIRERLRLQRRDEIGELAEAFDTMLDRLSEVIGAQRRFVADAAHELRTPLTALGGMVEMLQMGADRGDPSTIQRMLDTMEKEIARLGRLVRDLLSLSRLDAEQPILMAPVELAPIVSEVSNETRLLATGQDVVSRITATPAVLGDGDRLKQALLNLAVNALAFTPSGGHIEFELAQRDGAARLIVSDTGVGIDPAVLPRVMDRFFRADPSRARSTGGSGLGLAIARSIVEAHGGSIALESELGQGTRAIIELPVARRATNGHSAIRQPSLTGRPG
jgi:two-component system OmpR family sensor kinase